MKAIEHARGCRRAIAKFALVTVGTVAMLAKVGHAADEVRDADVAVAAGPEPAGHDRVLVERGEQIADIDALIGRLDRFAPVNAVSFSPDGALLASGSEDHWVRIWQVSTRRLIRRLEGHLAPVTAVAFSSDGGVLASASNDRTVRMWETSSGRLLRVLQGHVYHVYAVAFDPQGRYLATASWDKTIALWNTKTGALVKKLRGPSAPIRSVDFSPDGKLLAAGSDDHKVRVWSVDTAEELRVLDGHAGPVTSVRFRPDGEWLLSGSTDQSVRAWRLPDGATARRLGACGGPVRSLAVSPNGQILAGGCGAGGVVLWDIPTNAQLRHHNGRSADVRAIAFSPDGRVLAIGADDGSIRLDDVASGRTLALLPAGIEPLQAVAASSDGSLLAAASRDGRVLIWRNEDDRKALSRVIQSGPVRGLAFSPDGKTLVTGGEDGTLAIWNMEADTAPSRLSGHTGAVAALGFTPDGRIPISGGDDTTVRTWDFQKGSEGAVLKGHSAPVRALATSPDGTVLASASDDESVRVWDLPRGRGLAVLKSHRGSVNSLAFSSDGKLLVTGSQDGARNGTIDVWLLAKSKLLKAMRKELSVGLVGLAGWGGQIAVASSDGLLSLWELAGNRPVKQSTALAEPVSGLALARGGTTIASVSRDGVLRVWDAKTLEPRWSLAGSALERWLACNDSGTCWRREDGTLLGRATAQGDIVPVSPPEGEKKASLSAAVDWSKLGHEAVIEEDRTQSIPLRIENRGQGPAYFVNVVQSVMRTASNKTSLVLIPPPTIPVLAPGQSVDVPVEVSALGEYENAEPRVEALRLAITSASAPSSSVEIPVRVEAPHLKLQGLAFVPGPTEAVVASLSEVSMIQADPVRVEVSLTLADDPTRTIAPIAIEQVFHGQDLALSFPLPAGLQLGRHSRASLTVRKSTHPAHVWNISNTPVRIPMPRWLWVLLAVGGLGLGLVVWQVRLLARARAWGRGLKRFARLALMVARVAGRAVLALVFLPSTLRWLREHLQRRSVAGAFFRLQPETQCSHLARQVGASWSPVADGKQPLFELHFGPEVSLNVETCLLALSADGDAIAAATARLESLPDKGAIAVVLSETPRSASTASGSSRVVACSKPMLGRVLRAPRPSLAFAQVVSEQIGRVSLSLYRSAVSGEGRQPFYGRKPELRRLCAELRRNCLVIGPHGIGKTSLLDEVHRRLRQDPAVECHYLALADGDLTSALADALNVSGEQSLASLLDGLGDRPDGRRIVVLCDDADAWATRDDAAGGAEMQALASHNRDHRCCFILAGFLGLLHAARPLPGRKRVGDVVRLDALDDEACMELCTVPMAALGAEYARADLVDLIAQQSGGMPGLLVAICDQIVAGLAPDQHIIDRSAVESACKSEAVARAITAWRPRFGLQEPRFATLDQTVALSAIFKTHFTLGDLQAILTSLRVQATLTEIEHSARRLVAACVLEQWLGHFRYRVPLFQTVMQEATLARMISQ
jgi:WD40 repeat protein